MKHQPAMFAYTQLEESNGQIRLLHLAPSQDGPEDDIRCTFSLASLDENPHFEALSYVWGDQHDLTIIFLEGSPWLITRNLHDALIHMRRTTDRVLWIDAICINQADISERSSQVSQMRRIYAQASTVCVYLGVWEGSETAFRAIEAFGIDAYHHCDPWTDPRFANCNLDLKDITLQRSLVDFFGRPWWRRVWTVQEYVLAQRIVFQSGHHLLDGKFYTHFVWSVSIHDLCCSRIRIFDRWEPDGDRHIMAYLRKAILLQELTVDENRRRYGFLDVVARFRTRQCFDPLDKIYGLLGLAQEPFRSEIRLDYNLPVNEVYTTTTIAAISASQALDVFSYVCGKRSLSPDLPSWVPDFTAWIDDNCERNYLQRCWTMLEQFSASGHSIATVQVGTNFEATTQSVFIGSIIEIVPAPVGVSLETRLNKHCSIVELCRVPNSPYASPFKAYWQTLCGGVIFDKPTQSHSYRLIRDDDFDKYQKWQAWSSNHGANVFEDKGVLDYQRAFLKAKTDRQLAVLSTGHMGLVPLEAVEGDLVVLMPGGKVPYVLRQLHVHEQEGLKGTCRCEFVGDSYIHGVMHGEAWDETKLQTITLV